MRILAIVPILLTLAALIISFLCLFAGSKPNFMSGYEILSLNTSRVGQNLLQGSTGGGSTITNLIHNVTSLLPSSITGEISSLTTSLAHELGIEDFYSMYALDYCEGAYTPTSVPNATFSKSHIHMNVTLCSPKGKFNFTPGAAIQRTLDRTGTGVTLQDLDWPTSIDKDFGTLASLAKAIMGLYIASIVFTFLALIAAIVWLLSPEGRRLCGGLQSVMAFLAFVVFGVTSGLVTAVGVKGDHIIDKYGSDVGISANRSNKLLALTWAGVACLFIASIVGCFGCVFARRRVKKTKEFN